MTKTRNDFTIKPYKRQSDPDTPFWEVTAGGTTYAVCKSEQAAIALADALNIDPYHLERGQTRADRAANDKATTKIA